MQVLIIGGVAAGTKTAAKLKREMPDADVTILTNSKDISYASCGLPYYLSDVIRDKDSLIANTPEKFSTITGVKVETETEVVKVHPGNKSVEAVKDGVTSVRHYDKLVIATGASSFKPQVDGVGLPGIFCIRTPSDAFAVKDYIRDHDCKRAVVIGAGFIGLEVAENLNQIDDMRVTVVEGADQILPGFSKEVSGYVKNKLSEVGINVMTGSMLQSFSGTDCVEKVLTSKKGAKADVVVLSIGIRANTGFLEGSGVDLNTNKTIKVNEYFETSVADIYAVGDCISVRNRVTGQPAWSPMGSSANMEGRICAKNIAGQRIAYPGVLGTAICHLPGINVGRTGYNGSGAEGVDPVSVMVVTNDKSHYFPGAATMIIKITGDKTTGKLLGVEALGEGPVDKIIDIGVTALSMNADLDALDNLDLAYAPPFSTAISPFVLAIQVLKNKLEGKLDSVGPDEFASGAYDDYQIIDASVTPAIPGAPYVDYSQVTGVLDQFGTNDKLMLICTKGRRGYLLQNTLRRYGYTNTKSLEAGTAFSGTDLIKQ